MLKTTAKLPISSQLLKKSLTENHFLCSVSGFYLFPEAALKGVLKICSKFTGEYLCQSVISIQLICNFAEITLQHGCSSVNLSHIFRNIFTILQKHLWTAASEFHFFLIVHLFIDNSFDND